MTSLERTQRAISMKSIDRVPQFPILIAPACQLVGVKQRDYSLDPEVMADTLIRARDLLDTDGIYVSRDNWVYHEALGGELIFPEDDEPYSKQTVLPSVKEFRKLRVPDPQTAPGMKTLLAAARKVVAAVGDRYYIQANIDCGPFSLAAVLRGAESFLLDLMTENERDLEEFLDFCTEVVVAYGKAMITTGVHGIQYGDSTASLVGPEHYERFALPYQERSVDALIGPECDVWIHICGKTDHLLHFLRPLPIQGFEVDAKVPMTTARRLLGDKIAIKGNLDTTFLLRQTPQEVYDATMGILREGDFRTGIVMSPGCGVARMTPLENLRAMTRACADYRPPDGAGSPDPGGSDSNR
ncbi:MAG: uroporphyrinogen decarboxylase family protein [Spirochaetales bacterium]|nr:uroporphyrinogen decarboxylase family protein [Spirochaetales bacterium]